MCASGVLSQLADVVFGEEFSVGVESKTPFSVWNAENAKVEFDVLERNDMFTMRVLPGIVVLERGRRASSRSAPSTRPS